MSSKFVHVVVVVGLSTVVALSSLPSLVLAQQPPSPCPHDATPASSSEPFSNFQGEPSSNIQVDGMLRPLVTALRARSATFRRQWDVIAASPLIRVSVRATMGMPDPGSVRARAQVSRYAHGSLRATIEIPPAADVTELLPHEFEHVIEQLEGLDLPALARRGDSGVFELRGGVYETDRARAAGRQVVREVYDRIDPAVGAAVAGVRRFFRALGPTPAAEICPAGGPDPADEPPLRRLQPAQHLHKLR